MSTRDEALAQLTAAGQPYKLGVVERGGQSERVFRNAPPTLGVLFEETRSDLPFLLYEDE